MNVKGNSEQQILDAARKVFVSRGFSGARMQEIADEAGINKGLLHYYYKSKNRLFHAVFDEAFTKLIPRYDSIFDSNKSLYKKIELFITEYMTVLHENPNLPSFVLNEMNRDPDGLLTRFEEQGIDPSKFYQEIENRVATGAIVQIDPRQLFINIISMCMFPYIGGSLVRISTSASEKEYEDLMKKRTKSIVQFVINAIKR